MTISKVVTSVSKGIAYTATTIGACVWANDKIDEYCDKHELDSAIEVVKAVGYTLFLDGIAVGASVLAYNVLATGIDGWVDLGKVVIKAATEVSK